MCLASGKTFRASRAGRREVCSSRPKFGAMDADKEVVMSRGTQYSGIVCMIDFLPGLSGPVLQVGMPFHKKRAIPSFAVFSGGFDHVTELV